MTALIRDIRFALRSYARTPGFTLLAVSTIALGVGASTAIYSVVDGVLLEPLPYEAADRIVALAQVAEETGEVEGVSVANAGDWRERARSFDAVATLEPYGIDFMGPDGPAALDSWLVTEDFFRVMGVPALLGRTLQPEDYDAARSVVVIGFGVWQERFGGDPEIVGRTLPAGDGVLEIVGVMPPTFEYPAGRRVWAPVRYDGDWVEDQRGAAYLEAVARLAPGASVEAAAVELRAVMAGLREEYPSANAGYTATLEPLPATVVGSVRPALLVLLGAAGLLLLIATANVANLMLTRAADRGRLAAVRSALGASRGALLRSAFAESLVLGGLGGALGVLVAFWGLSGILVFAPAELPRAGEIAVDGTVLAFAAGVSLLMVFLFGLAPAIRHSRPDLRSSVASAGGRGSSAGPAERRLRATLVAGQVAIAVVLLTAAGLLVRSFVVLINVDRGYRTENVIASTVQAWGYFRSAEERTSFARDAVSRLAAIPGVREAGVTSALPLDEPIGNEHAEFQVVGRAAPEGGRPTAHAAAVDAGYFRTLDIPRRAGRLFDARDHESSASVAIVNETLARRYWAGADPVGERLTVAFWGPDREMTVVGVVADVRTGSLEEPPPPTVYVPHAQAPTGALTFVVRTVADPGALVRAVRETIWEFDPAMPIEAQTTLDALMSDSLRTRRFHLFLLGAFATLALVLASIGIYGVVSYSTWRRTREIGIRIALGAGARSVIATVMAPGAATVGIGLAIGLVATVPFSALVESLLFGVAPLDPLARAVPAVLIGGLALLAMLVPARAATRVDPALSLRSE
jgi:putative ABC transport system permease protein